MMCSSSRGRAMPLEVAPVSEPFSDGVLHRAPTSTEAPRHPTERAGVPQAMEGSGAGLPCCSGRAAHS
jgi:hypothetical protein